MDKRTIQQVREGLMLLRGYVTKSQACWLKIV